MAAEPTRRRVLQWVGAGVAAGSLGAVAALELAGAVAVGRAYLASPAGAGQTLALLRAGIRGHPALAGDWLRQEVKRNFAQGDVVMVDGWMLARVEAQACAILFLRAEA